MNRQNYYLTFLAFVLGISSAMAQYKFDSKKAEKLYYELEEYYAEAYYDEILDNEKNIEKLYLGKEDTLAALMLSFLGESYLYWEDDLETSLDFYLREYELRKRIQPGEDHKNLAFNVAYLYDEMGNYQESEGLYLELLKSDEKEFGRRSEEYFMTASSMLDHYINTYQIQEGLELANRLKRSVKKNTYNEALLLRGFAELYTQTGEFRSAERNIVRAIEILEETGYYPSLEYVYFLNTMSFVYQDMGQLAAVEDILNEALSVLARLQGDYEEDEVSIKSNLAILYIDLGDHGRAEETLLEVLGFDTEYYGEDSYSVGFTNYNLGLNAFYQQDYDKAEQYLLKAAEIFEATVGTENVNYARALNNLASTYGRKGDYTLAQEYGQKSIAAHEASVGKQNPEYAWPMQIMGEVYQRSGDLEKAEEYQVNALRIRARLLGENHPFYAKNTRLLAVINWDSEDMDDALDYYNETFDNYFAQINAYFPVLSEDEKSKFYYNNLKPTFEEFNSFIIENRSEDKKLLELMYNYQLSTKGLILYATSKVRESILKSGDTVLLGQYDTWIGQKEQLARLFSAGDMDPEIRTNKIDSLQTASNELEGQLSQASSAFASSFANRDLTWRDVQARLKPGEAAIEIIRFRDFNPEQGGGFSDEVYYAALIVTPEMEESPDIVIMRNGREMETKYLANYRNAIRYQVAENFSYRLFWRPIANKLQGVERIYFSPDGVYNQISIYTLQNPASKKYLIDEYEIQLVTNTKDLVAMADAGPSTGSTNPSYLFGYPNYNMGAVEKQQMNGSATAQKSAAEAAKAASENRGGARGGRGGRGADDGSDISSLSRGGIPRGIRGNLLRYMRSNSLLALLPGTQREVNLIDSLYEVKNAETIQYMSNDAVEERIKEADNPKTLHIATHGFFLEHEEGEAGGATDKYVANPLLRSGLILAGANSYISTGAIGADVELTDDGILTAYEAMNLNLDETELVVLSACETGLGEIKNGEGVFGLQRAFQIAGADAIIMSMWTVDDDATQQLMTNFYEEWLTSGDKQQAFITAQKRLKDTWKSPYYWGAFVMVGN